MARIEVPDSDTWKRERFDAHPAGRQETASGYRLYRSVENPNKVIVQAEFGSAEDARSCRERLTALGSIRRGQTVAPPLVVEEAEVAAY